ncbi:MAG: type II secretion system F family protein [Halobacteriaceae archaeon]
MSAVARVDRLLYAVFADRAGATRHERDRQRYRATTLGTPFDLFVARVYGLSWVVGLLVALVAAGLVGALSPGGYAALAGPPGDALPLDAVPVVPQRAGAVLLGIVAGALAKRGTVAGGGRYLAWRARARRVGIERTLPGAARYLRALASGSDDGRGMLGKVAGQPDAYGETAVAFREVRNKAALTGSFDSAVGVVARDTPSQDALAPFLLKFREYADQGSDALEDFLRLEGRMLARRQRRERRQAEGFLELLAELFIVLLVLPTLVVIVLTVLSVLSPGLGRPVATPVGAVSPRVLVVYGSAAFVVGVGAASAWLVAAIRPPNVVGPRHDRARGWALPRTATVNPASAAVVFAPLGAAAAVALWVAGLDPVNVAVLGYATYCVPVGLVALRRSRRDDAKDRQIKDFVHAVAGHVSLGRPFPDAVELVAREVDLGALDGDVADLAFNLQLTSGRGGEVRTAALRQFVRSVGTPLAEQTVGLVTGALDVGSDPEAVFDTLQAEVGRLHHERKALRSELLAYVAVGWTTGVLVVGVMVAVNLYVLESFDQLAAVSDAMGGYVLAPEAVDPARDRYRFYVVTQATMLACGWFAGYANRGRYDALLHSGLLVLLAFAVFTGAGAV